MFPEILEHSDVLLIAASTLDQAYGATAGEFLDVIDRRLVEIHKRNQVEYFFVDIQNRHVAAKATRQGGSSDFGFSHNFVPLQ